MTFILNFDEFCKKKDANNNGTTTPERPKKQGTKRPTTPNPPRRLVPEDFDTQIMEKLIHMLETSSRIIVILGAGVSVSAGIPVPSTLSSRLYADVSY